MPPKMSLSQYKSKLRQAQSKQRQAISKYNREVNAQNQKVKSAINRQNQEIRKHNGQVRAHNTRVRANRQRLKNEINKLNRSSNQTRYMTFRISVDSMQSSYVNLENQSENQAIDERLNEVLDLSEKEAANNIGLMNALLEDKEESSNENANLDSDLDEVLSNISQDLVDRWRGALFSLNPNNPDAARHFCTSAREVITEILETKAPDDAVMASMPGCQVTDNGKPTRRVKISYFLKLKGIEDNNLEEFVEEDMKNVVQLFRTFNDGTHGTAGRFNYSQLVAIKLRVEGAVTFLWKLIA